MFWLSPCASLSSLADPQASTKTLSPPRVHLKGLSTRRLEPPRQGAREGALVTLVGEQAAPAKCAYDVRRATDKVRRADCSVQRAMRQVHDARPAAWPVFYWLAHVSSTCCDWAQMQSSFMATKQRHTKAARHQSSKGAPLGVCGASCVWPNGMSNFYYYFKSLNCAALPSAAQCVSLLCSEPILLVNLSPNC